MRRCLELRRICLVQHNSGQENVSEEEVMVLYVTAALYPYVVPKIGLTKLGACDRLRDYVMRPDIQVPQLSGNYRWKFCATFFDGFSEFGLDYAIFLARHKF